MNTIKEDIIKNIKEHIFENPDSLITGQILQDVLVDMTEKIMDRDVFLTDDEYDALVESGRVDPDKIYHIYENE